jgi:transporter family protein
MITWLPFALFALAVWSLQRVVTKTALVRWSTPYFYRLNAALSLVIYVPFALFRPPDVAGLPGAFALSLLMALTFWVTTEATRRGPVGLVAPLTSLSPAITATLAIAVLGERPPSPALVGIAGSVLAGGLLAYRPAAPGALAGWLGLALVSLALQGFGAFFAKVVVTGPGPTDLLVTSAAVQLAIGAFIARREPISTERLSSRAGLVTALILVMAAVATIGYLYALSEGPASVIVPLVATSPALGGLLGIVLLRERATGRQLSGIALGASAALLLASA